MKNAIALGSFDGLHSGHRAVLSETFGYRSVAVTFRIPPKAVGQNGCLLMTPEDKEKALKDFGVDKIEWMDFETVREQSPEEFLQRLLKKYQPVRIVCGYNYRFGKDAAGDAVLLAKFCAEHGVEAKIVGEISAEGQSVSSTGIRALLREGKVEEANRLLYRDFCFSGEVLHGDARGRTLGFPTANLVYPKELASLKNGVYAVKVCWEDEVQQGLANIGFRPTFQTESAFCEAYIFGFEGDLYGKELTVYPERFLRPERQFSSVAELREAISRDIASVKDV